VHSSGPESKMARIRLSVSQKSIYLSIYAITPCPSRFRQRGYCAILLCLCILVLQHLALLTLTFRMYSIPSIYPIRGLTRLFSATLSALYIILVSLFSFILSICPNHLSLFRNTPLKSTNFSDSLIPRSICQLLLF
jgi:hypothetical protein